MRCRYRPFACVSECGASICVCSGGAALLQAASAYFSTFSCVKTINAEGSLKLFTLFVPSEHYIVYFVLLLQLLPYHYRLYKRVVIFILKIKLVKRFATFI